MSKIIILVGISGSGKSTLAHEMWRKSPLSTVIVNRDKIRELSFGYTESTIEKYYEKSRYKHEDYVTKVQDSLITLAIEEGKHVIVDNTNLNIKNIQHFSRFSQKINVIFVDTPLELAIERANNRLRRVSADVVRAQYVKYKQVKREYESKNPNNFS